MSPYGVKYYRSKNVDLETQTEGMVLGRRAHDRTPTAAPYAPLLELLVFFQKLEEAARDREGERVVLVLACAVDLDRAEADHANLAIVVDGGAHGHGRPFWAILYHKIV